jgi:hypothetical protein
MSGIKREKMSLFEKAASSHLRGLIFAKAGQRYSEL